MVAVHYGILVSCDFVEHGQYGLAVLKDPQLPQQEKSMVGFFFLLGACPENERVWFLWGTLRGRWTCWIRKIKITREFILTGFQVMRPWPDHSGSDQSASYEITL